MPRGGHNAKSTAELKRAGTFRPDRHGRRMELPPADSILNPPADFDAEHTAAWFELCEILKENGILTAADHYAIRTFVEAQVMAKATYAVLMAEGFTLDERKHPAHLVYAEAVKTMRALYDQFGLTPRARMSMKVEPKAKKENNAFAELMELARRADELSPDD